MISFKDNRIQKCKLPALKVLNGGATKVLNGGATFLSEIKKHCPDKLYIVSQRMFLLMLRGELQTVEKMRSFIEKTH